MCMQGDKGGRRTKIIITFHSPLTLTLAIAGPIEFSFRYPPGAIEVALFLQQSHLASTHTISTIDTSQLERVPCRTRRSCHIKDTSDRGVNIRFY